MVRQHQIYIGYDKSEVPAYHTLSESIMRYASEPVSITPLKIDLLKPYLWRARNPLQSTDFSFSRFLVPFLSGFEGHSLFMDCDMLVVDDIVQLFKCASERYPVSVVKVDIKPNKTEKMLGAVQTNYEKKCWSAVMLFNNRLCQKLTPYYVNTASGLELHQFKWLGNDDEIGELPKEWQYVMEYSDLKELDQAKLIHFTESGPWWKRYRDIPNAELWHRHYEHICIEP